MAYTKQVAVTTPGSEAPAMIIFTQDKDKLFDIVSLQSNFMTKSMKNEKGEIIGEEYALSADEKSAFEVILEVVLSEVFEVFKKHTNGISDSYKITDTTIAMSINDHAAYNDNDLDLIDMAIKDSIVDGCLQGWFGLRAQGELTAFVTNKFRDKKELLKARMFTLKMRRAFVANLNSE